MREHYRRFTDTKQLYAQALQDAQARLKKKAAFLANETGCPDCGDGIPESLLGKLHADCGYKPAQLELYRWLDADIGRQIMTELEGIATARNQTDCHMCGLCCRLASSEHTYDELLEQAESGDAFARQFTSVFLPYASRQAAQQAAPELVAAALTETGADEKEAAPGDSNGKEAVYFYHCPYIGEDNRCTVYGTDKRPPMCESYPETPLVFMADKCAWQPWKASNHPKTIELHAMLALCTEWSNQLRQALA